MIRSFNYENFVEIHENVFEYINDDEQSNGNE